MVFILPVLPLRAQDVEPVESPPVEPVAPGETVDAPGENDVLLDIGRPVHTWFGRDVDSIAWRPVAVDPVEMACGDEPRELRGDAGSVQLFILNVTTNMTFVSVKLAGGGGDADLYLRRDAVPDARDFDERPFVVGNEEEIAVMQPAPGVWYFAVHGAESFENVTMSVDCGLTLDGALSAEVRSPRDIELSMYYEFSDITLPEDGAWSSERRNRALRDEGRAAFSAGDYMLAMDAWTKWSRVDPDNPEPVALIGDAYLRQEDIPTAVDHYRRSLEIQPGQIALITRLALLIDQSQGDATGARDLLNFYEKLFPGHPELRLAKAQWLIRRKRFDEAGRVIRKVIAQDPSNLRAYAVLHGLLRTPGERFDNMRTIRENGLVPGREMALASAISENNLLTRPESWVMMDTIERMACAAPSKPARQAFAALAPRTHAAREDFRYGRLSDNWVSSREQMWSDDGSLMLTADLSQTEAYLRLKNSESMNNGFVEVVISEARGFFWLYARRGEGNMIRFGFDHTGMMYQQIWMDGQLLVNDSRLWSKPEGEATLRLEVRADGVLTFVDGRPAFGAPMSIPRDMGLGWWGIAPWSPDPGVAAAQVVRVAGGPLPVRLAVLNYPVVKARTAAQVNNLQQRMRGASVVAPFWYSQASGGNIVRLPTADDVEIRLLSRYYRARLLPLVKLRDPLQVSWDDLVREARREKLDGFTIPVARMPPPAWIEAAQKRMVDEALSIHLVLPDPDGRFVAVHELAPYAGLFSGGRRIRTMSYKQADQLDGVADYDLLDHVMLQLCPSAP